MEFLWIPRQNLKIQVYLERDKSHLKMESPHTYSTFILKIIKYPNYPHFLAFVYRKNSEEGHLGFPCWVKGKEWNGHLSWFLNVLFCRVMQGMNDNLILSKTWTTLWHFAEVHTKLLPEEVRNTINGHKLVKGIALCSFFFVFTNISPLEKAYKSWV